MILIVFIIKQIMNTNDKGNLGYAMTIADVTKKGYFIFTPLADTTNVDLVIANNKMELKRIQVKYRKKNKNGVLEIPTTTVINGKKQKTNIENIDIWAIYCPDTNEIYYLPTNIFNGKNTIYIRIDEPMKKLNNINYAKDYINLKF